MSPITCSLCPRSIHLPDLQLIYLELIRLELTHFETFILQHFDGDPSEQRSVLSTQYSAL